MSLYPFRNGFNTIELPNRTPQRNVGFPFPNVQYRWMPTLPVQTVDQPPVCSYILDTTPTTAIYAAAVKKLIISTRCSRGFQTTRSLQATADVGSRGWRARKSTAWYEKERPKEVRKSVQEACKMHIPKAGIKISTALTVQGKPKDKLKGLCEKEKKKKQGKRGEKGTNY